MCRAEEERWWGGGANVERNSMKKDKCGMC